MKYRGHFIWKQTLDDGGEDFLKNNPHLILFFKSVEGSKICLNFKNDFEFESEKTDWEDLRKIIVQMYEREIDTRVAFSPLDSPALISIHLEEVKNEN